MKKIFLFGKHAKRTPFIYPEYRKLFIKHFEYVKTPEEADFLVFGFAIDIQENSKKLRQICLNNSDVQLVVLSEEPLWDIVWSNGFFTKRGIICVGDDKFLYHILNHCTTKIYDFDLVPYFLTTNDDYFVRYSYLFNRNQAFTNSYISAQWERATIRKAFYAEKRKGEKYDVAFPEHDIVGLCTYRTQVANEVYGDGVVRIGRGWGTSLKRQSLPDWHLDKLAALDLKTFIVSALENTHQRQYLTEKIFDAFAVLAVPLYFASPFHSITRLLPQGSFVNLFDLSVDQAVCKTISFKPDNEFLELYCLAQSRLANIFSNPSSYVQERKRVVAEVVSEIKSIPNLPNLER